MTDNLEAHTRICCQMEAIAGSMETTLDARLTRLAAFMERRIDASRPRVRSAIGRSRSTDSHQTYTGRRRGPRTSLDNSNLRARAITTAEESQVM